MQINPIDVQDLKYILKALRSVIHDTEKLILDQPKFQSRKTCLNYNRFNLCYEPSNKQLRSSKKKLLDAKDTLERSPIQRAVFFYYWL